MILAAGRGQRMRPLTDHTPKPLLVVHGRPLIEWHLLQLAQAGVREVVINTGWLGDKFEPALGRGERFNLRVHYSHEGIDFATQLRERGQVALETAGGIARALPMLVNQPDECFWVVAGDVFMPQHPIFMTNRHLVTGFAESDAMNSGLPITPDQLAHICLVPNPAHRIGGDFAVDASGRVHNRMADVPKDFSAQMMTYSTLGLYRASMFESIPSGNPEGLSLPLVGLMREAAAAGRLGGQCYNGSWADIGTPEALAQINFNSH